MSVINTNVKSLVAQGAMVKNERAMSTAMAQLSTGSRINSAKDDAAGQAISQKMTAQIRGLNQAVRNGNDGISLLQTAEGAMVEVTNMLQRMRELAVQSASDTNTADDRAYADDEFQQLKGEINRIAKNTQWNGMNILNGNTALGATAGATADTRLVKFQVGANADQTIDVTFKDLSFTPNGSNATKSTVTINMQDAVTAASVGEMNVFKGKFGTGASAKTVSFAVTGATATAIAASVQSGIQQYSGLENVTVAATGNSFTITDPNGNAVALADFSFEQTDGTAQTDPVTVAVTPGTASTGASTAGSLFNGAGKEIHSLDLKTLATANTAITNLDGALKAVNAERSNLGSVMNRLTYAVDNLANVSQNATESRSRVLDTDYAQTTTQLARTQIISQAATAMLAQANQAPQSVLALLK
jgi:flagellin